jgi:hypothetical protein
MSVRKFFDRLILKYSDPTPTRPKSFFPRPGRITPYALTIDETRQALIAADGKATVASQKFEQCHQGRLRERMGESKLNAKDIGDFR